MVLAGTSAVAQGLNWDWWATQKQQAKNLESRTRICGPPSGSTLGPVWKYLPDLRPQLRSFTASGVGHAKTTEIHMDDSALIRSLNWRGHPEG
jgi:hypothetical protein